MPRRFSVCLFLIAGAIFFVSAPAANAQQTNETWFSCGDHTSFDDQNNWNAPATGGGCQTGQPVPGANTAILIQGNANGSPGGGGAFLNTPIDIGGQTVLGTEVAGGAIPGSDGIVRYTVLDVSGTYTSTAGFVVISNGSATASQPLLTLQGGGTIVTGQLDVDSFQPNSTPGLTLLVTGGTTIKANTAILSSFTQGIQISNGSTLSVQNELDIGNSDSKSVVDNCHNFGTCGIYTPTTYGGPSLGIVTVDSGSTINAGLTRLGILFNGQAGNGTLNLTGMGTSFNGTGSLIVGDSATGTLNITSGATASTAMAAAGTGVILIGNASGSNGTVTVNGGTLTSNGYMAVGNSGNGTLTVTNGGQVMNTGATGNGFVGGLSGSVGMATVTGTGSLWQTSGSLTVGDAGYGTLTVSEGAMVKTQADLLVGNSAGGFGALNINQGSTVTASTTGGASAVAMALGVAADSTGFTTLNNGSTLDVKNSLVVGYDGAGDLAVQGGSTLTVEGSLIRLGRDAGSQGTLTVTGAGSSINSGTASTYVGYSGQGSLNILSGASVDLSGSGTNLSIGTLLGGYGTVTVDGQSAKTASLTLYGATIGDNGTGALVIKNGGDVTLKGNSLIIGNQSFGAGTLSIDGVGSTLAYTGNLQIGNQGRGTVNVTGGATFGVGNISLASTGGILTVSGNGSVVNYNQLTSSGSSGTSQINVLAGGQLIGKAGGTPDVIGFGVTATVDGSSNGSASTWFAKSGLDIEAGSLTVSNGAQVNTNRQALDVNAMAILPATLNVTGAQSLLATGALDLGEGATMTVSGGGSVKSSGAFVVGSGSTATIMDSTSTLTTAALVVGGGSGNATLNISGGNLTVTGFSAQVGAGSNGFLNISNQGTLNATATSGLQVGGPGATGNIQITGGGQLLLGSSTLTVNSGTVQINSGGMLDAGGLAIGGGASAASVTLSDTGIISSTKKVSIQNAGTLTISNSASMLTSNVSLGGGGTIDVRTGGLTIGASPLPVATNGNVNVNLGGVLSGGTLSGSKFQGNGTILGNLNNFGGRISPGDPETFDISGNYTQTAGILDLQIDGTAAGQYDQFLVSGAAMITGGTLQLDFGDGFAPAQGETFDLFGANEGFLSMSGEMIDINGLAAGFEYQLVDLNGSVDLMAMNNGVSTTLPTPEPSSLALLALGIFGALFASRRFAARAQTNS